MALFSKKDRSDDIGFGALNPSIHHPIPEEEKPEPETKEEWIWVEGYKGTDKDMCCRGYQYSLGTVYDMGEDAKIEECENGFHLCKELKDTIGYYNVADDNRFFKVKALVRKSDFETYGYLTFHNMGGYTRRDKLVARSIEFIRELTIDEIFEAAVDKRGYNIEDFSEDDKKRVITLGIKPVWNEIRHRKLESLGYSKAFAAYIIKTGSYEIAYAVGTQENLSMDMKVMLIFNK